MSSVLLLEEISLPPPSLKENSVPIITVFTVKELVLMLVSERYLPNLRDLASVSSLTRRTRALLYDHPDLVLARELWSHPLNKEDGEEDDEYTIFDHDETPSRVWNQDREIEEEQPEKRTCKDMNCCLFLQYKVMALGSRADACLNYQRYRRALYFHGNLRVADFFFGRTQTADCDHLDADNVYAHFAVDFEELLVRGHLDLAKWFLRHARDLDLILKEAGREEEEVKKEEWFRNIVRKERSFVMEADLDIFPIAMQGAKKSGKFAETLEFLWEKVRLRLEKKNGGKDGAISWRDVFINCMITETTRSTLFEIRKQAGDQINARDIAREDLKECIRRTMWKVVEINDGMLKSERVRDAVDSMCYLIETGVIGTDLFLAELDRYISNHIDRRIDTEIHMLIDRFGRFLEHMYSIPTMQNPRVFDWRKFMSSPTMKKINMRLIKAAEFGPNHAHVIENVQNQFLTSVLEPPAGDEEFYLPEFLQKIRRASSITTYMKFVAERLHDYAEEKEDNVSNILLGGGGEGANKKHKC